MVQRTITTLYALHARPLDRFVRAARTFAAEVQLAYGGRQADGKNVVQLLLLAVPAAAEVTLTAEGPDEAGAIDALGALLAEDPAKREPSAPMEPVQGFAEPPPGAITGIPGAAGVGVGLAHREDGKAPARRPSAGGAEKARLRQALDSAERATAALIDDADPFCDIFRAQQTLLGDPWLGGALFRAVGSGATVEQAVDQVFAELEQRFEALGPGFAAERHADVADVRERLLDALSGPTGQAHDAGGKQSALVWILAEATPSRMATLDRGRVAAVISQRGGPTSHAAIVARGRGIPLVFAAAPLLEPIQNGQRLRVDGQRGTIELLDAGEDTALEQPETGEDVQEDSADANGGPGPTTTTADGWRVRLRVNLGAPGELAQAQRDGCDGCGVLRTELLFAGRTEAPSVEEQAEAYSRIAQALAPQPTVVRLFDVSSDKPLPFLPGRAGERNPALGLLGIRLLLRHPDILADQLQAVRQARTETGCDLRVLVPMVVDATDLAAVRQVQPDLPLGAMIETPAAALLTWAIATEASFLSIGSNDLAQYMLAADRTDADLCPWTLHPAVLRLVHQVALEARGAGVECSLCGELAGDVRVAPLLVGLGIDTLSVSPARLVEVREALRLHTIAELEELAGQALGLDDPKELEQLLAKPKT